jgi:hypothetical protein
MRTQILLALSLAITLSAAAQPPSTASVEARRAAKLAATATFLDRAQPQEARLAATKNMGYPEDRTLPPLLAVARDRKESDAIRLAAFRFLHWGDEYLAAALKVLDDPNDGGVELDAGLIEDITRHVTFRLPDEQQQRILRTFRRLQKDKRDKVRLYAFRASVAFHDSVALNTLTETLRKGSGVPIPVADAIDLLDQDGPQNYIGVLRPYLDSTDPLVQARAARALAVDPESRPKIVRLASAGSTPAEVRLNALRGLAREDRDFAEYDLAIVENAQESPDIRYAAMHAFVGRMNYENVATQDQIRFAQAVERIAAGEGLSATNPGRRTTAAAKELLAYLKKAFPAIKTFYATPR